MLGFGVWDLGFGVWGLGLRLWGSSFQGHGICSRQNMGPVGYHVLKQLDDGARYLTRLVGTQTSEWLCHASFFWTRRCTWPGQKSRERLAKHSLLAHSRLPRGYFANQGKLASKSPWLYPPTRRWCAELLTRAPCRSLGMRSGVVLRIPLTMCTCRITRGYQCSGQDHFLQSHPAMEPL